METNQNQAENNLDLMSFNLGEAAGGEQMIVAHKAVSETEHYVFTLGDAPQETGDADATKAAHPGAGKSIGNQVRNLLGHLPGLNANKQAPAAETKQDNIKLRCFKLTRVEGQKYLVDEYVTPEGVSKVARMFNADKGEPEITK